MRDNMSPLSLAHTKKQKTPYITHSSSSSTVGAYPAMENGRWGAGLAACRNASPLPPACITHTYSPEQVSS